MGVKCPKCQHENPDDTIFCGKCATRLPSPEKAEVTETLETPKEELTTGSTFAERYQIIEELGKGGMGRVYKAHDTKIKEKIALKLIKPEIAKDKKTIERFSNELRLARKVRHKNVCGMFDIGEEKGTHYITMEFVPGEDLRSLIRRIGQLPIGKSIAIAKQICEGLAEAHRLGVVHRDLKSNNIMIDKEGNVRIMDFGIARSIEAKGITGAGVMIGTPEYMSPEQVEGKEVDQRSDIYSLGIILYEMVTGRVPFEGDTPFTVGVKHKSEMPQNPKELNTQISDDLNRMILRCLEKEKERRYQSTGEVCSELENIERGIPTTERIVPERKPLTSREITVTFGLKKLLIPAVAVIGVVLITVVIWKLIPKKEVVPIPSGKPSLAIMYFENDTGDEGLDHYRKALSDLLIADLSQSKFISIVRGDKIFNVLSQLNQLESKSYSSEILKEVATRSKASHILQGNYTKAGENFRINIMLHDANTEELIGSEMVEGVGEESIFPMVDELTRRIKANLRLTRKEIASDLDKEVGKITTSSPEAFKFYSEGRMYHQTGDFRRSIQLMERAVAIDPEFAMAYRSLSASFGNLGYGAERKEFLRKAFELSERASDREKYIIQGDFFRQSEKTYDKAIEAYERLLELYPEDSIGNTNSAILYSSIEDWDKAIERLEVLRQAKDDSPYSYTTLSRSYSAKGLYRKAEEVLEDYLNNISDSFMVRGYLALTHFCQRKFDLALVEADKMASIDPNLFLEFFVRGDTYSHQGKLLEAEKQYQKLLENEELTVRDGGIERLTALYILQGKFKKARDQAAQGIEFAEKLGQTGWRRDHLYDLAYLNLILGNPEAALEELEVIRKSAVEEDVVSWQKSVLYAKGLVYVEMKYLKEAKDVADGLKKMIEEGLNSKEIRFHHHLLGLIELERKNFSEAIGHFKKAIALLPYQHSIGADDHSLFIDSLASAYFQTGDLEKAIEEYERITNLTSGRFYQGDTYAKSFYMLGKIFEQQANKAKAIEHYERFLDLWKDADPGLPEVADARKRLAGLKET